MPTITRKYQAIRFIEITECLKKDCEYAATALRFAAKTGARSQQQEKELRATAKRFDVRARRMS